MTFLILTQVGILENEYRVLPLEVIAGENRLEATVNQHKARFKLNYAEVNSSEESFSTKSL